jgi:hypothetical protein
MEQAGFGLASDLKAVKTKMLLLLAWTMVSGPESVN